MEKYIEELKSLKNLSITAGVSLLIVAFWAINGLTQAWPVNLVILLNIALWGWLIAYAIAHRNTAFRFLVGIISALHIFTLLRLALIMPRFLELIETLSG